MIYSIFKKCLHKENAEYSSFNLLTAINSLYLLTKGFVIFKKDNELNLYVNEKDELLKVKDFSSLEDKEGYLLMPFKKDKESLFLLNKIKVVGHDNIISFSYNLLQKKIEEFEKEENTHLNIHALYNYINNLFSKELKESTNNDDFKLYEKAFLKCKEFLKEHKKIVLSRCLDLENGNISNAFLKALSKYPYAHTYLFVTDKKECFMAATPETLASFKDNTVFTMSLAGSMQSSLFEDYKNAYWSLKNQEEQKIVTDYIIDTLKNFKDDILVSLPYTFKAGPVIHIRSDIKIQNKTLKEALDIATLLNPTPAVCGNPTLNAYKFLCDNEYYDREYYSGVVGYKDKDSFSFFVNLRCLKFFDNKTRLYAGGGLIESSSLLNEYEETLIKMKTLKEIL